MIKRLVKISGNFDCLKNYGGFNSYSYHPFGMQMPGRKFSTGSQYRYGFNGKENDKDISEGGQDYGFRIYDSRLAKFLSVDPLTKSYPWYTPYQFAGNLPIWAIDLDGLEPSKNKFIPGVAELYGMFIVGNIYSKADDNYHNSEWFKSDPVIKGTNYITEDKKQGKVTYITDTDGDPTNKYNMKVSNSSAFFVDESNAGDYDNYERAVTLGLLKNFVTGKGAENYVFPKNGIISSKFLQSSVLKDGLKKYLEKPSENYQGQSGFALSELVGDAFRTGTLTGSITGMAGSAFITITPTGAGINVNIFNITSLYSDTLGKEAVGSLAPTSYVREEGKTTTYGNISQTYQLFIPFNETGDKYKNIKDVVEKGKYDDK